MTALEGVRVVEAGLLVQGPQAAATLGHARRRGDQGRAAEHRRPSPLAAGRPRSGDFRSAFFIAVQPRQAQPRARPSQRARSRGVPPPHRDGRRPHHELPARHDGRVGASVTTCSAIATLASSTRRARRSARSDPTRRAQGRTCRPRRAAASSTAPAPTTVTRRRSRSRSRTTSRVRTWCPASSPRSSRAARTGRGQRVDVSLLGSQIWAQASEYTYYLLRGSVPGRSNKGHPMIGAIYGIFPTSDGWIAIVGVIGPLRSAFYELLGRPELPRTTRVRVAPARRSSEGRAVPDAVRGVPRGDDRRVVRASWVPLRSATRRCATYAEVAADPQVWENGYLSAVAGRRRH